MKRLNDGADWCRLVGSAAAARDHLRQLIPQLDAAIEAGNVGILVTVREVVGREADRLRLGIKHPRWP